MISLLCDENFLQLVLEDLDCTFQIIENYNYGVWTTALIHSKQFPYTFKSQRNNKFLISNHNEYAWNNWKGKF